MLISLPIFLLYGAAAVILGCLLGWLSQRRQTSILQAAIDQAAGDNQRLHEATTAASVAAGASEAIARGERERAERLEEARRLLESEKQAAERRATTAEIRLEEGRLQSAASLALLSQAREELSNQFKTLAGEIFEEKSKRFTDQNRENLGQVLTPLRERIQEFQVKVEQMQRDGIEGRSELRGQLGQLKTLNERLSLDATNLVTALKGSSKVQGDWGEFVLERLLEASGLRKGHEYETQATMKHDDCRGARLDVVVNLPGARHLVIDSKLSLTDYSEFCSSEEPLIRNGALARHLASVRTHLKGLSERNYQSLYGLRSLDFVVMFVPIEPAFMLAIAHDSKLWSDAWQKNVLLVSPSTLLFVIRTVAHLWKQEQQTQNAKQIAKRGADLYDKFVGFVDDLDEIGNRLTQARESYDTAYMKLSSGRGNLVKQAEMLRELGVRPKKTLATDLIASAGVQQEDLFELGEPEESTRESS